MRTEHQIVALIQARMGSSRLPGKMMMPLADKPILYWVIKRLSRSQKVSKIILLTSENEKDSPLVNLAKDLDIEYRRGSERDVLSRFEAAANEFSADFYLRVCADNPFICPIEVDRLIEFHSRNVFDYSFNHIPKAGNNYADGFGAEAVSPEVFKYYSQHPEKLTAMHREHVTSFIWENSEIFNIGIVPAPSGLAFPDLSFDIDTIEDFERMQIIASSINIETTGEQIIKHMVQGNL